MMLDATDVQHGTFEVGDVGQMLDKCWTNVQQCWTCWTNVGRGCPTFKSLKINKLTLMLDSLTGGCGYYGILSSGVFSVVGGIACARMRECERAFRCKKNTGDPARDRRLLHAPHGSSRKGTLRYHAHAQKSSRKMRKAGRNIPKPPAGTMNLTEAMC